MYLSGKHERIWRRDASNEMREAEILLIRQKFQEISLPSILPFCSNAQKVISSLQLIQ